MTRPAMLALTGLLLAAAPAAADDHRQMRAAERDLESARSHLQAAARDFGGHRRAAIEDVDKALDQIHRGLAVAARTGPRTKGHSAVR